MNKPVAWINTRTEDERPYLDWEEAKNELYQAIPLYIQPVKELTLTDEDILEEWTCKYSDCYQDTLIEFAKAILRKAQEK